MNNKTKTVNILNEKILDTRKNYLKQSTGFIQDFMYGVNLIAHYHETKHRVKTDKSYIEMFYFLKEQGYETVLYDYHYEPYNIDNQIGLIRMFNILSSIVTYDPSYKSILIAYHSLASFDIINILNQWREDKTLDYEQLLIQTQGE